MRAMMSTGAKRPWDGQTRFYRAGGNGSLALDEATRIMAETEPLGRDMAHGTFSRGAAVIPFAPARAALAEALAAFVSEDPYCSCLPESLAIALDEAGTL
jgi:hypothetical protein